jgi:hypothetical protein
MTRRKHLKPWIFGLIAGLLFVGAEALFGIYPPSAYAFCLACHVRDLMNTVLGLLDGARFQTSMIAKRALLLTSPGVLLGAFLAARVFREHRVLPARRGWAYFLLGFAVMTVGIVIFGCPTRIALRAGYGEVYGLSALLGLGLGTACGTLILRLRFRRSTDG